MISNYVEKRELAFTEACSVVSIYISPGRVMCSSANLMMGYIDIKGRNTGTDEEQQS